MGSLVDSVVLRVARHTRFGWLFKIGLVFSGLVQWLFFLLRHRSLDFFLMGREL